MNERIIFLINKLINQYVLVKLLVCLQNVYIVNLCIYDDNNIIGSLHACFAVRLIRIIYICIIKIIYLIN